MKKILIGILLIAVFGWSLSAQVKPFNPDNIEVGIVEKLDSLLPMDLTFLDESGNSVVLGDLIDKPTILSFVYYDCPGACGPLLAGVSEVVSKLDMDMGVDYQVLTFSFDPKDSPQKGNEKKKNYVLPLSEEDWPHWKFLTSDQQTIYQITEAVGWRYKVMGLDFAHPSAIIICSPEGKITRYLYGLNYLPFDVKMALIEAKKGQSQPTINKVLEFCFSFDPQSRTYTLQITRIVGSFIVIIALSIFIILLLKGRRKTDNK